MNDKDRDLYIQHLYSYWSKLEKLPVLCIKKIKNADFSICEKMVFYAIYGHNELFKMAFIKDILEWRSNYDDDIYHCCCYFGNLELLKYLETKEFDIHHTNQCGDNVYLIASIGGHIEVMKYLESKGFNIHIKNQYEMMPIYQHHAMDI